jgi:hypothetical protein
MLFGCNINLLQYGTVVDDKIVFHCSKATFIMGSSSQVLEVNFYCRGKTPWNQSYICKYSFLTFIVPYYFGLLWSRFKQILLARAVLFCPASITWLQTVRYPSGCYRDLITLRTWRLQRYA